MNPIVDFEPPLQRGPIRIDLRETCFQRLDGSLFRSPARQRILFDVIFSERVRRLRGRLRVGGFGRHSDDAIGAHGDSRISCAGDIAVGGLKNGFGVVDPRPRTQAIRRRRDTHHQHRHKRPVATPQYVSPGHAHIPCQMAKPTTAANAASPR